MPNRPTQNPPTFAPSKSKPGTFIPNPDEAQERRKKAEQQPGNADQVEIGDPVPENDRVTRANEPRSTARGQGETGEDEDLPDDTGGIEGTRTDRH